MPGKTKKSAGPSSAGEDVVMQDAAASEIESHALQSLEEGDLEVVTLDEVDDRITILAGSTDTAASYQFQKEDHTLGNALRYIIMKNPNVEFCGYSIPHPSEELMNIRIQTYEGTTAIEALKKGLEDLMDLCDVVADKFTAARDDFLEG